MEMERVEAYAVDGFTAQVGRRVAVFRQTQVDDSGTHYVWWVGREAAACDGPCRPTFGHPSGWSETWHGWGTGVVTAIGSDVVIVAFQ